MEYRIVEGNLGRVEALVRAMIEGGWRPAGGASCWRDGYGEIFCTQAMTRGSVADQIRQAVTETFRDTDLDVVPCGECGKATRTVPEGIARCAECAEKEVQGEET